MHPLSSPARFTSPLLPNSPAEAAAAARCPTAAALLSLAAVSLFSYLLLLPSTLPRPSLILISFDGFRFGYQFKVPTPNIDRLTSGGTSAALGLVPVFPTLTIPNHYSVATGLYPPHHGIISNYFADPLTGDRFANHNHDPKWWVGEPIWQTVADHNLTAAVYFWPGGEVQKGSWTCPPKFCPKYYQSVPFEDRIDTVLSYFDLDDSDEIPTFTALYFSDPDSQGHRFGPDHADISTAVAHLDEIVGRLIDGLEKRGIFEEVTLILVGDHGMVGTCRDKYVYLEDLKPWIEIPTGWVQSQGQLLAIYPSEGVSTAEVVEMMNAGLSSGNIENGHKLRVYLKEDLLERLHYSDSDWICPIIGLVEEGYTVEVSRSQGSECGGEHGYDNDLFSMRSIFVGHGPRFEKGWKIPSFENVEIYNLITSVLGLKGAQNNGSDSFVNSVLLLSS